MADFQGVSPPWAGCDPPRIDLQAVERDFGVLAPHTRRVRLYASSDGLEDAPRHAAKHGLAVIAGAWLNDDRMKSQREVAALIRVAHANPNIERVIVGNETVLRYDPDLYRQGILHEGLPPTEVVRYIRHVRRNVRVPVSTAEPTAVWLANPELARAVDFLTVHLLPYWDLNSADSFLRNVQREIGDLRRAYPQKSILVGEIGHPSAGDPRLVCESKDVRCAKAILRRANPAQQADAIRRATAWFEAEGIDYFVIEATDQPWKQHDLEGVAGGYWGLWDADRKPKWSWTGPVDSVPHWPALAAITCLLCLPVLWALCGVVAGWAGRVALAGVVPFAGGVAVWAGYEASTLYLTVETAIKAGLGVALPIASLAFLYVALRRLRSA